MDIRKKILVICNLYKNPKRTLAKYINKILQLNSDLNTVHPTVIAFMVIDITSLNGIFSIFSLTEHIEFMDNAFIDL